MYYSEEVVDRVREANDIVDLISGYVKLNKKGANYMGLCPFHSEKSPSFSVSRDRQMYHCFGCGTSGNVFTFLMEYENFTFPEAIKYLGEQAGIELPQVELSDEARKQADIRNRLLEMHREAARFYVAGLRSEAGKKGWDYFQKRNLSEETIRQFGLGYASVYSNDLYHYLRQKGYEDSLLKDSGLIRFSEKDGGKDYFWNRVMFPIMDVNSKVIAFGGRVLGDGEPKYLNSPETKIFEKGRNLYGLNIARRSRRKYMILCEGYMDVIALHQAGFDNAVAALGTAFTPQHAALLKRYTEQIYVTFDSDGAGIKAALRALPMLKAAGLSAKVVSMKPYKDPDEFIKNLGKEEYEKRIEQAELGFYFETDVIKSGYDLSDPEQKTKFHNELAKKLLLFQQELERENYLIAVARRYDIPENSLRKLVVQYGMKVQTTEEIVREKEQREQARKKVSVEDSQKKAQALLLTWLCEDVTLFEKLGDYLFCEDFTEEPYRTAARLIYEQYENTKTVTPARILNHFTSLEDQKKVGEILSTSAAVSAETPLENEEREKAINQSLKRVLQHSIDSSAKNVKSGEDLKQLIERKKQLENLYISL